VNNQEHLQKLQESVNAPPFHRFLKMRVVSVDSEKGIVVMRLPFQPAFTRSDKVAQIHGGVSAAFIDIAGDYALVALLGHGVPTINLRIDYLRMAENTDLIATARVIKAGRSIGVVDIEVCDESNRIIAVGRGNYSTRAG
jgi:uncharacterized protein (TIGR00369 family)